EHASQTSSSRFAQSSPHMPPLVIAARSVCETRRYDKRWLTDAVRGADVHRTLEHRERGVGVALVLEQPGQLRVRVDEVAFGRRLQLLDGELVELAGALRLADRRVDLGQQGVAPARLARLRIREEPRDLHRERSGLLDAAQLGERAGLLQPEA